MILITRPEYDEGTSYLSYYAGKIIDLAKSKSIEVLDLKRPRLTQKIFSDIIAKKNPLMIFFNAHGDERSIYGDKEEILVEEGKNHQLLDNRLVYARACLAAASLGKACKGCFIGYTVPFIFWIDERWSSKPANDNLASICLEPSNLVVECLLKGNTAQEASDRSLIMAKSNIMKLLKTREEPGTMANVAALWNNMQGQVVLGNSEMKFSA